MQAERTLAAVSSKQTTVLQEQDNISSLKKKSKEQHWKIVLHSHLPPSFVITQRCTLARHRAVTDWSFSLQKEEKQFWQLVKLVLGGQGGQVVTSWLV